MLHCLQSANHCFDSRAYLLVLLQQRCPFGGETIQPLSQCAIFFAQLGEQQDEFVEAGFKEAQFLIDNCGLCGRSGFDVAHAADYAAALAAGSNTVILCESHPVLT